MTNPILQPDPTWQTLDLPADTPPVLTVVIDTEEEFDWDANFNRAARSTTNILEQPLAQKIMDHYGVVPTYVIDYPVANTPEAVSVLRNIQQDGRCEIGAHLHPWVNPPYEEPVDNFHSFPGNLPPALEREKLLQLVDKINSMFDMKPSTYKAGRYGLGPATYSLLEDLQFHIDTSVVPYTDFTPHQGPNFRAYPTQPFRASSLISLPHTIHFLGHLSKFGPTLYPHLTTHISKRFHARGIASKLGLLERLRLTPEGYSLEDMKRQTQHALARGERYFMLSYHSSTLLPGATYYSRNKIERDAFLTKLDAYFNFFMKECNGRPIGVTDLAETYRHNQKMRPDE